MNKKSSNLIPHIIQEPLGWDSYGYIKSSSFDHQHERIVVTLANNLVYILPISFLLTQMEFMQPYTPSVRRVKHDIHEWSVRTILCKEEPKDNHSFLRIHNRRKAGRWLIDSEVILIYAEAAYEDYCCLKYLYSPPEPIIKWVSDNADATKIYMISKALKESNFFSVERVYVYREADTIHLLTRHGDRYETTISNNQNVNRLLRLIGAKFRRFNKNSLIHCFAAETNGSYVSADCLDVKVQEALKDFVMKLAFEVDYRFKGHYADYVSNKNWSIYPGKVRPNTCFMCPCVPDIPSNPLTS